MSVRSLGSAVPASPAATHRRRIGLDPSAVHDHRLGTCIWTVTSLARPLPATYRTGRTHLDGGITFTPGGTALVGPNNHWANRAQNPLVIWPTLLG